MPICMSKIFVVLLMLFFHIVDDYYLQGLLANMKQKSWWEEHAPQELYRYDYIIALLMHSMSWSFMVMLPIAMYFLFSIDLSYLVFFFANAVIHAIVDDKKANRRQINLIADQLIHILQIATTAIAFLT